MPALAFGLGASKKSAGPAAKPALKRKAVFAEEEDDEVENEGAGSSGFASLAKKKSASITTGTKATKLTLNPILDDGNDDNDDTNKSLTEQQRSRKSPQSAPDSLSESLSSSLGATSKPKPGNTISTSTEPTRYANLSALRTAKLHDEAASNLDSSVYDYDAVYDTFHANANNKSKTKTNENGEPTGPKYMTSLLASAETRKRDQLRAKEKLLQKERENEGDEFADKEKFVTGAYKKQQEETRRMEEEEKQREQEEEERRRKGGGMEAFNRNLLRKEEERQKAMQDAMEEVKRRRKENGEDGENVAGENEDDDINKAAEDMNKKGARIVVNDDGEIVDKRQLLGAGLNVAPSKKPDSASSTKRKSEGDDRSRSWQQQSHNGYGAKMGQRERQTRMIERQIEDMTRQQEQAAESERKEAEEKNKSKLTEDTKLGAKERYLQRKKEKEAEAAAAKQKAGG